MQNRFERWLVLSFGLTGYAFCPLSGASLPAALQAYLEGLDQISAGHSAEAAETLGRAEAAAPKDPRWYLARGAAFTLSDQFEPAIAEFTRARQLRSPGREADLWLYAVEAMVGRLTPAHNTSLRPEQKQIVSMPTHLVQGGDDYPTDFASLLYYEVASPYQRARESGPDRRAPSTQAARATVARYFANRHKAEPDLAPALLARARTQIEQRDFPAALENLVILRGLAPADPEVALEMGHAWLGIGRPMTASHEFTRALLSDPHLGKAYLGRALAESTWGDVSRANRDYARALGMQVATKDARQQIDRQLLRAKPSGTPASTFAALEESARSGAPDAVLLASAKVLHVHLAILRQRYDEMYQWRVAELTDAITAKPKQAGTYLELAQFLAEEADVSRRGESVEPRRPLLPYRALAADEQELQRALALLDRALAIDGRRVPALLAKANILSRLGDDQQAERLVDETLALNPREPEALRLRAEYWINRANNLDNQTWSLRGSHSESSTRNETRSDGVHEITTTTYYSPSSAQLALADSIEAAARELRARAADAISAALKVTRGTTSGLLLQAEVDLEKGDKATALASLQAALKQAPASLHVHEAIVTFYRRTGQIDQAEDEQSDTSNLFQTTAAWRLRRGWRQIEARKFAAAEVSLVAAQLLDPVDARAPAYLGLIREAQGRRDEAATFYRLALALETARIQFDEPFERAGDTIMRDPLDFGLAMRMRDRLAALSRESDDAPSALALYLANTAIEARITSTGRSAEMFTAMLPVPGAPPVPVPAPVNAASMLAQAHQGAGKILQALGRENEAQTEFMAVANLGAKEHVVRVGSLRNGRMETNRDGDANGESVEAYLELAKAAIKRGDSEAALKYINLAPPIRFPPDRRKEAEAVLSQVLDMPQRSR